DRSVDELLACAAGVSWSSEVDIVMTPSLDTEVPDETPTFDRLCGLAGCGLMPSAYIDPSGPIARLWISCKGESYRAKSLPAGETLSTSPEGSVPAIKSPFFPSPSDTILVSLVSTSTTPLPVASTLYIMPLFPVPTYRVEDPGSKTSDQMYLSGGS